MTILLISNPECYKLWSAVKRLIEIWHVANLLIRILIFKKYFHIQVWGPLKNGFKIWGSVCFLIQQLMQINCSRKSYLYFVFEVLATWPILFPSSRSFCCTVQKRHCLFWKQPHGCEINLQQSTILVSDWNILHFLFLRLIILHRGSREQLLELNFFNK